MANSCPVYTSPEWIQMSSEIGEKLAHDVFVVQGDTPILGIANNGNKSKLYEFLSRVKPKLANKVWYASKTLDFQNKYKDVLFKDENGEYVLTKKFIDEYIIQKEWDLPLFYKPIKELGSAKTTAFIKDVNFQFFKTLFNESDTSQTSLLNLKKSFESIYLDVKDFYETKMELSEEWNKTYSPLMKHWDAIIENHKQYLKQFKVDVEKSPDQESMSKDTYSYKESNTVSMSDIVEDPIRMLIASLPDVTRVGSKAQLSDKDIYNSTLQEFNTRSTVNYNKIMKLLQNELTGMSDWNQMKMRIKELALKYDSLGVLVKRLGLDSSSPKEVHLLLQAQFYRAFDHNKTNPIIGIVQDNGNIIFNDMALDSVKNIIKNRWLNKAKELAQSGKGYFKVDSTGKFVFDISKIPAYSASENRMDILAKLGFIPENNTTESLSNNSESVVKFLKWFRLRIKDGATLNDLFNRDVVEINAEIESLLSDAALFEANDVDLMYFSPTGELKYGVTLNSYLSKTINRLNNYHKLKQSGEDFVHEDIQHLVPYDVKTGIGNHYTVNSKMFGEAVKIVLLEGFKAENKDGDDINSLKMTDYKGMVFTSIMKGLIPYLRSADRRSEYAIESPISLKKLIEEEFFVDDMFGYLKDELTVTFAFLKGELGTDLKNASKHLGTLRTFDFLFEGKDLREIIKNFYNVNKKAKLYDKDGNQTLADKFIEQYKDSITEDFKSYINNSIDMNIESLLVDGVITELNDEEWEIKAIDKESLEKLITVRTIGDSIVVRKNQFREVVRLVTYNYFIGTQEQLKLILGDLANFKNPVQVHKRTNGGTSTKQSINNSQEVMNIFNSLYSSMDGAKAEKNATEIVYDDVIIKNETLGNIYPEYNKITSTDGQTHATLDEYRRMMSKNGTWGNREETYQYESQLLARKILNSKELQEVFPFSREDFIRLFGKHTNNTVPLEPMFNGKIIDKTKLPQLPPLKPQGFGNKAGYNENKGSFTTNDFTKMAVTPLLPSTLSDEVLKRYLNTMKNQTGFIFFESAKKSDVTINKDGSINDLNTEITKDTKLGKLSYDNFSIQLEVHDYFEGKVTQSTQRTRLEFLDLFLNGEFAGKNPELAKMKAEFDSIINEMIARDRVNLFKELGLLKNKEGEYRLIDENVPKFKKRLLDAFLTRNMPYNVVDGLVEVLASKDKKFDVLVSKREIESVLLSLGRNDILKRQLHGELLVQESDAYYGEKLNFYTQKETGEITAMEVIISLPQEWNEYVESLGGLDVFNKMIADKDKRIDRRILEIPANRIPSHGMNSLESLIVKKFLPSYAGNKIIVPGELTIKSGGDFDVDKLTTYFKNVRASKEGLKYHQFSTSISDIYEQRYGRTLERVPNSNDYMTSEIPTSDDFFRRWAEYNEIPSGNDFVKENTDADGNINYFKANSKEALENRLMEISNEVTLAPERFLDLIKPTDADTLKDLARKTETTGPFKEELKKVNSGKWSNVTQLWYNMYKAETFWTSKSGLALTATHIVAHASQQHSPINITSKVFKLYLDGIENSKTLGLIKDSKGNKISQTLAEYLTAFVDAATDDFIFTLNASPATVNSILMMVRLGLEPKMVAKFFTQPIIIDYLKNRSVNESLSYQSKNHYKDKTESVQDVLKLHGIDPKFADTMIYPTVEAYLKDDSDANYKDYAIAVNANKYKSLDIDMLSKKTLTAKEQVQILDNFLTYQQYSVMLGRLQRVTRPDSGMVSSRNELRHEADLLEKVEDSGFFSKEDIDNFKNNSFLKEFFISRKEILDSVAPFFLFEDKKIRSLFNKYFAYLDELELPSDKLNKILTEIEDNFTTALMINALTRDMPQEKLRTYYEKYFTGENSIAKWALKFKKLLPNNALIKELTPLIQEFSTTTGKELTYDNLKLYNRKFTTDEVNLLVSAYEELSESKDKAAVMFAADLMRFLYMQSGLSNSPINFIKIVPNKYLLSLVPELKKLSDVQTMNLFEDIMKNSWSNSVVIPRVAGYNYINSAGKPAETISVKPESRNAKYPFLVKMTVIVSKEQKSKLQSEKKRVPKEALLYKYSHTQEDGKKVYKITNRLGDGFRMTELAIRDKEGLPSIIDSNNVGYIFTNNTIIANKSQPQENNWDDIPLTRQKSGDKMHSLGSQEFGPQNKELDALMKNYLQAVKVDIKTLEAIYQNGKLVENAVSAVDLIQKTVLMIEGKISKRDLPEEAAHWYVELLGTESNLYKVMMRDIVKYPEYREVSTNSEYRTLYDNDEILLKKEAVAKLIANSMLKEFNVKDQSQPARWWNMLMNMLRNTFGWRNPFAKSAYNILNSKLDELKKTSQEVSLEAMGKQPIVEQLKKESPDVEVLFETSENLSRLGKGRIKNNRYSVYAKNDFTKTRKSGNTFSVKAGETLGDIEVNFPVGTNIAEIGYSYINPEFRQVGLGSQLYKQTIAQLLEEGYELRSDSVRAVSKDAMKVWDSLVAKGYAVVTDKYKSWKSYSVTQQSNKLFSIEDVNNELKKETTDITKENILKDFDKLFPDFTYFTEEEKSIFIDSMNKGQLEIACGL